METRNRGTRVPTSSSAAPQVGRPKRQTQAKTAAKAPKASAQRKTKKSLPAQASLEPPESTTGPSALIARRGAPRTSHAASINSIPTRAGVESEAEEEDWENNEPLEVLGEDFERVTGQHEVFSDISEEGQEDEEERETRLEVMAQSLPDLLKASEDLFKHLQRADHDSAVFQGLWTVKERAFHGIRGLFEESGPSSPFIDWFMLKGRDQRVELAVPAAGIMLLANLTTALNSIEIIETGEGGEALDFLRKLDAAFPDHLTLSDTDPHDFHDCAELALGIRAGLAIETLANSKSGTDAYEIIASIFCDTDAEGDFAKLFAHGPFKALGSDATPSILADQSDLCSSTISAIVRLIKKPKLKLPIAALRAEFPLDDLLHKIKNWIDAAYAHGFPQANEIVAVGEDAADSQAGSVPESQPIGRVGQNEAQPSLFKGISSVQYLNGQAGYNNVIPPSNQQQARAPSDYQEHTNQDILTMATPPPAFHLARRQAAASGAGGPAAAQQPHRDPSDDEAEDDDAFEEDSRPLDKGKRPAVTYRFPSPKRVRIQDNQATAGPSAPPPSSSMPPPAIPNRLAPPSASSQPISSQPISSQADFQALKVAKQAVLQQRAPPRPDNHRPGSIPQRNPWSDADCRTLLELIRECHAAWARIEDLHNHRFEFSRNQQAYRDKARNMKVDYLMTDAALPPFFDLVALGKKEIQRLESYGKNPYRREQDVDYGTGRAINTELHVALSPQMQVEDQ